MMIGATFALSIKVWLALQVGYRVVSWEAWTPFCCVEDECGLLLQAVLGGNSSPSADDINKILGSGALLITASMLHGQLR